MGRYSIKELEKLSGIKAHTIRIWEKRHHLVEPQRTQTNIRFYSDDDLKKIIRVSLLNTNGLKISKIAGMGGDEMDRRVLELSQNQSEGSIHIDQLIIAMVELDEEKFEKILSSLVLRFTFERTIVEIIYPFLKKVGVLWRTHHINPAQEHFISNLIRQKLIVAIDALPIPPRSSRRVMLFLPENELHEISLLFSNYLIRKAGHKTFYLGQTVPHRDLKSAYEVHRPDTLVTSLSLPISKIALENYMNKLAADFSKTKILLTGNQVHAYTPGHKNIFVLRDVKDLDQHF
jgi:DNA-binding transcriptional MerR regulator